ncbi:hypothetical protein [Fischerella sp. FACHB-380]|nr:hypothetical protein [Fischerella sp. FACHB-380]
MPGNPSTALAPPCRSWGPVSSPSPYHPTAPNPQRQVLYAGKPVHRTGSSLSVVGTGEFPAFPIFPSR